MAAESALVSGCDDSAQQAARLVSLWRAVDGCSQALRTAAERVAARHELNATQLIALWVCGEAESELGQSDLAARIGVSAAQASALVEQLRRRNLLEPRRAADDRRKQHWTVTAAGRGVVEQVAIDFAKLHQGIMPSLDGTALAIGESLNRLRSVLHRDALASRLTLVGVDKSVPTNPEVRQ